MQRHRPVTHTVVLALMALFALCVPLLGTRISSYDRLTQDLAAGRAKDVRVAGALHPPSEGCVAVWISWRDGWLQRGTEVRQWVPFTQADPGEQGSCQGPEPIVLTGDVESKVSALGHGVHVESATDRKWSWNDVAGWRVWGPAGIVTTILWLWGLVVFLASRDEPPFATRWGWGWWFLSPASLVAVPAYLLSAIWAWRRDIPANRRGRLTGGWSFLLSLLFAGAVASWFGLGNQCPSAFTSPAPS